jgi:hypothetical protein
VSSPDAALGLFDGYDDLMGYAGYLPGYASRRGGNLDTYAYAPSNGPTSRKCAATTAA